MALAVQVQYWNLIESMRHNRVAEGQEMFNFETNRLNQGVNQQNANTNAINANTNIRNADINQQNANTNLVFAAAATKQANAAIMQANVAGVNALTNIKNAQTNALNADTNQRTVIVSEALMPSQRAKNWAGVTQGVIGAISLGKGWIKGLDKMDKGIPGTPSIW